MPVASSKLRIAILGSTETGKSAIVVRYLTRRFITEYSSSSDFLYTQRLSVNDSQMVDIEILDTSNCHSTRCLLEHITWADAFVVVYSICDQDSYRFASELLETLSMLKSSPTLVLANKIDLADYAQINTNQGLDLCNRYNCLFYEVSAADSFVPITLAFESLLIQSRDILFDPQTSPPPPPPPQPPQLIADRRPKISSTLRMSKMFGLMLGRMGKNGPKKKKKKQKSLSI